MPQVLQTCSLHVVLVLTQCCEQVEQSSATAIQRVLPSRLGLELEGSSGSVVVVVDAVGEHVPLPLLAGARAGAELVGRCEGAGSSLGGRSWGFSRGSLGVGLAVPFIS